MVVIVIIGLLAGVDSVSVRSYLIRSKQNVAKMEIAKICQALDTFYTEFDRYSTSQEGLEMLIEARHRCKLSQAKLAEKIGVSWNMIAMCERNFKQPSVDLLGRWCNAIGLELIITFKRKKP